MSMQDPEDHTLTRGIVGEQQHAIDVAQRIQRGQVVGNLSQLPQNMAVSWPQGENARYLVIVKYRDASTGATGESMHEVFSDVPILYGDLRQMAIDRTLARQGNDTISGALGSDASFTVTKVVLISATRR